MIAIRIEDGLGNQLFRYAAARRLALHHDAEVVLVDYCNNPTRPFSLPLFNIKARMAGPILRRTVHTNWRGNLHRRIAARPPFSLYIENDFAFCPKVLALPDNTALRGFFQSELYFADVADAIRADLQIRHPILPRNRDLMSRIKGELSVSLHVRRGDYLDDSRFPICAADYYARALEHVASRAGDGLHVFVFTDDPDWAQANLRSRFPISVVRGNDSTPVEDLRLMSACRHHIIANSSFSWWGAWLNACQDKIVVAPGTWFSAASELDFKDVVPASWTKL